MQKPPKDNMPANEFGQLRAYLAQQGVSQAEIDEAIGTAPAGRTRAGVADDMGAWLKTREKDVGS